MMETTRQKRLAEEEKILKRDQEIVAKMAKLEMWKKELRNKVAKKTAEAQAAKVYNYEYIIIFTLEIIEWL